MIRRAIVGRLALVASGAMWQAMAITCVAAPPGKTSARALVKMPVDPMPPPWGRRPISFLREVQPIFDTHCVGCHSGITPAGGLDFFGGLISGGRVVDYGHNRAFDTIIKHRLVAWSPVQGDASVTQPLQFGSQRERSRTLVCVREYVSAPSSTAAAG